MADWSMVEVGRCGDAPLLRLVIDQSPQGVYGCLCLGLAKEAFYGKIVLNYREFLCLVLRENDLSPTF